MATSLVIKGTSRNLAVATMAAIKDVIIEIVSAGFVNNFSIQGNLIVAGLLQQVSQPLVKRFAECDVAGLVQD